jgi:predicted nucleic acid-binding protein
MTEVGIDTSVLGNLNFNDALIALSCHHRDIPFIASFDRDFDNVPWLQRIAKPEDLPE